MTDSTNGVGETLADAAQDVAAKSRELGREFRQRANDVRKEAAKQLFAAAETIRKEAHEAGAAGDVKQGADEIAKGLEKAAAFLRDRSVEQMGDEAVRVVRKNPMRAVIVAFIVGLIIGLLLREDK